MTDKQALLALAGKVEQAAPQIQSALMEQAWEALAECSAEHRHFACSYSASFRTMAGHFGAMLEAQAFLDAAMTLVPEGYSFQISSSGKSAYATVVDPACEDELDTDRMHSAPGRTPALALTAAALRARAGAMP